MSKEVIQKSRLETIGFGVVVDSNGHQAKTKNESENDMKITKIDNSDLVNARTQINTVMPIVSGVEVDPPMDEVEHIEDTSSEIENPPTAEGIEMMNKAIAEAKAKRDSYTQSPEMAASKARAQEAKGGKKLFRPATPVKLPSKNKIDPALKQAAVRAATKEVFDKADAEEARIAKLEEEGCTRSDAQGIVMAEDMKASWTPEVEALKQEAKAKGIPVVGTLPYPDGDEEGPDIILANKKSKEHTLAEPANTLQPTANTPTVDLTKELMQINVEVTCAGNQRTDRWVSDEVLRTKGATVTLGNGLTKPRCQVTSRAFVTVLVLDGLSLQLS